MSEPFISPIKIRLKELLVIFPCVHPVVIGGLSQWLFVGSSCVSDSSPLDEKDVWPTNASEKIKTRLPLKNHTPHDCHFSMSPFLLQGCFLPYHFVVLCSLLDIKFTRCVHLYEAVWSVIWSEHKDVVRSGLEPELRGEGVLHLRMSPLSWSVEIQYIYKSHLSSSFSSQAQVVSASQKWLQTFHSQVYCLVLI